MAELQQPDIVGNYLSRYNEAQQRQQALADRQRTYQRQDRQDDMAEQQFAGQMDAQRMQQVLQRTQLLANATASVKDGDEQGFAAAKEQLIADLQAGPEEAEKIRATPISRLPQLRLESGLELKKLQLEAQRANIRQSDAAAAASNRANRGGGAVGGGIDNTTFDNLSSLRKEYTTATKDFGTMRDAYGRIKATAGSASPAGDIAMIYAYMKMLDPGSVVRETEFATAQNAKPLLDRLGVSWDAVKSAWEGNRLQPAVRADFLRQADSLYRQQQQQYESTRKTYTDLSGRFGFDPSLVVTDQAGGLAAPQVQTAPQPAQSFVRGQGVFTDQPVQQAPAANGGWSIKRVQ